MQGTNSPEAQERQKWCREGYGDQLGCFQAAWSIWLQFWPKAHEYICYLSLCPPNQLRPPCMQQTCYWYVHCFSKMSKKQSIKKKINSKKKKGLYFCLFVKYQELKFLWIPILNEIICGFYFAPVHVLMLNCRQQHCWSWLILDFKLSFNYASIF